MSRRNTSNLAQSIWSRLLIQAKAHGEEPSYTLLRFAAERLLYRLSVSPHSTRFVLKGAMLFAAWADEPHRSTKDVDLLGYGSPEQLVPIFREVCSLDAAPDDAVRFDAASVRMEQVREEDQYGGRRVLVAGRLGNMPLTVQGDVGFGDAVTPGPRELEYPVLLEALGASRLKAYPPETVIAEKFEAMVKLGMANSRMKDFFDIWVLSRLQSFDLEGLRLAVRATFSRRATPWPSDEPTALTTSFSSDVAKQAQWRGFLRRTSPPQTRFTSEVSNRIAGAHRSRARRTTTATPPLPLPPLLCRRCRMWRATRFISCTRPDAERVTGTA